MCLSVKWKPGGMVFEDKSTLVQNENQGQVNILMWHSSTVLQSNNIYLAENEMHFKSRI